MTPHSMLKPFGFNGFVMVAGPELDTRARESIRVSMSPNFA